MPSSFLFSTASPFLCFFATTSFLSLVPFILPSPHSHRLFFAPSSLLRSCASPLSPLLHLASMVPSFPICSPFFPVPLPSLHCPFHAAAVPALLCTLRRCPPCALFFPPRLSRTATSFPLLPLLITPHFTDALPFHHTFYTIPSFPASDPQHRLCILPPLCYLSAFLHHPSTHSSFLHHPFTAPSPPSAYPQHFTASSSTLSFPSLACNYSYTSPSPSLHCFFIAFRLPSAFHRLFFTP